MINVDQDIHGLIEKSLSYYVAIGFLILLVVLMIALLAYLLRNFRHLHNELQGFHRVVSGRVGATV